MEIDHDLLDSQNTCDLDNTMMRQSIMQWGCSGACGPLAFYPGWCMDSIFWVIQYSSWGDPRYDTRQVVPWVSPPRSISFMFGVVSVLASESSNASFAYDFPSLSIFHSLCLLSRFSFPYLLEIPPHVPHCHSGRLLSNATLFSISQSPFPVICAIQVHICETDHHRTWKKISLKNKSLAAQSNPYIPYSLRDKIIGQRPTVQVFVVQFHVFSDVM